MKCPHCHKDIKIEKSEATASFDFTGLFVRNLMMWLIPYAVILNIFDNHTSLPVSMEDGLIANYWMIPMIIIGIGLGIYCFLYEYKKVKGTFLFKG